MEKYTRLLILIGVVLIAASSAYWFMLPGETDGEYGDVTVERAMELIEERPSMVILDVRTEGEFRDGHIEGDEHPGQRVGGPSGGAGEGR